LVVLDALLVAQGDGIGVFERHDIETHRPNSSAYRSSGDQVTAADDENLVQDVQPSSGPHMELVPKGTTSLAWPILSVMGAFVTLSGEAWLRGPRWPRR
jgi:hypothetical protein